MQITSKDPADFQTGESHHSVHPKRSKHIKIYHSTPPASPIPISQASQPTYHRSANPSLQPPDLPPSDTQRVSASHPRFRPQVSFTGRLRTCGGRCQHPGPKAPVRLPLTLAVLLAFHPKSERRRPVPSSDRGPVFSRAPAFLCNSDLVRGAFLIRCSRGDEVFHHGFSYGRSFCAVFVYDGVAMYIMMRGSVGSERTMAGPFSPC